MGVATNMPPGTVYEIVGSDGLRGAATGKFISVTGPCGEGHTMSRKAAKDLLAWLKSKLESTH